MSTKDEAKAEMKGAIEHLIEELKNIRTGRANPSMLDNVMVEVYGTPMRIRDIANVTVPEPRQLLITPYDQANTSAIGKAIEKANLGFRPITEANVVRINIPSMDQKVREDMIKLVNKRREEAKVSIRHARAKSNKHVHKEKADGNISEDIVKRHEKEIQELTDSFCKEVDTLCDEKEKEVSTI